MTTVTDSDGSTQITNGLRTASFPPRILVPCGGFVTMGGAERMTFEALRLFRERGVAVHCILNSWENHRIAQAAESIGATWSTGAYLRGLRRRTDSPLDFARMAWDILRNSGGLINDWLRFRAPVVVASDFGTMLRNAAALPFLKLSGVKIILLLQNAPPGDKFYRRLFKRAIDPFVTRYVCASKHSQAELAGFGISPEKIDMVNNFAPVRERTAHGIVRDPGRVVFIGQIIPPKGLDLLLEAIALLASGGHDVRLDIVGKIDGWTDPEYSSFREAVLRRAKDSDLRDRVSFLGWRDDAPELLRRAAVHCAPSRATMLEGMPLVCLEAKEAGTPSVVSPVGPFPELVTHKVDGWICEDLTAEALADGIEFFISDPIRSVAAGRAAMVSSARFSKECFQSRWEAVFETLDA